jgi:hypothetical protein
LGPNSQGIVNTAGRDIEANGQQNVKSQNIELPVEKDIVEKVGLGLGRYLVDLLNLRTVQDLILKTLIPGFISATGIRLVF